MTWTPLIFEGVETTDGRRVDEGAIADQREVLPILDAGGLVGVIARTRRVARGLIIADARLFTGCDDGRCLTADLDITSQHFEEHGDRPGLFVIGAAALRGAHLSDIDLWPWARI